MTGRPSDYTQEIASAICERLADGESLREICKADDMPARSTVFKWLSEHKAFSDQYTRAREEQADLLFEEALSIADNPLEGVKLKISSDGKTEESRGDMIEHRRLQVDVRKWMVGKLAPKKYGEKVTNIHEGGEKPVEMVTRTDRERAKAMALLATKAKRSA